ncbi:MAG: acyl carrier protein [bacterium]|nr:acyl carrier protein [bacterium]
MERSEILERARKIVVEVLGVGEEVVIEKAQFKGELGADSLDVVDLIMEVEKGFKIEIPDEDAEKVTTFGQMVDEIAKHFQTQATS